MIKTNVKFFICVIMSLLLLVGCWDMVEIDQRLFTGIFGIDTSDEKDKFTFYFSFPVAREIVDSEGGEGGEGGGGKAVETVSTVGSSIVDGTRNLALRLNREISFEHMRIIVISEDVARDDLRKIMDPLSRGTEFNRRSRIAFCRADVEEVLAVEPWVEKLKAEYMESIYAGSTHSGKFIEVDLGDFLRSIRTTKGNALVSKIKPNKSQVKIGGAGVVKDYKLIGWLGEEETQGVNFFLGKIKGGDIVEDDPHGKGTITLTILGAKRKLNVTAKEPLPKFTLEVFIECNVASIPHVHTLSLDDITKLESLASNVVEKQISKGVNKLKNYEVDLLRLGDHLHKYEPKLWKKYQENWDDTFSKVDIDIVVHTTIRNIGVIL